MVELYIQIVHEKCTKVHGYIRKIPIQKIKYCYMIKIMEKVHL